MNRTNAVAWMAGAGLAMLLAGCGGGNGGSAKIGGTVSGLATNESLVLTNNGGDNTTVSADGSFTFAKSIGSQGAYSVQVLTQPATQTCSVSYGSGVVDYSADAVTKIAVVCSDNAPVGATISGLASGATAVLSLVRGGDSSTLLKTTVTNTSTSGYSASTIYRFTDASGATVTLPLNTLYTVAMPQQPAGQTCAADTSAGATPYTGGVVNSNAITVNFICH